MDVTGTTGGMNNIILALILLRNFDRYSNGFYWNNWRYEQYNIILALILLRTFDRYSDRSYWNNWRYE